MKVIASPQSKVRILAARTQAIRSLYAPMRKPKQHVKAAFHPGSAFLARSDTQKLNGNKPNLIRALIKKRKTTRNALASEPFIKGGFMKSEVSSSKSHERTAAMRKIATEESQKRKAFLHGRIISRFPKKLMHEAKIIPARSNAYEKTEVTRKESETKKEPRETEEKRRPGLSARTSLNSQ